MKTILLSTLAGALLASPVNAWPCSSASSGFIRAAGQTICIRKMGAAEIRASEEAYRARVQAEQDAVTARLSAQRQQVEQANSKENVRALGRAMDVAGDSILEPGGQERYRDALELYTDAAASHNLKYKYGIK